jgi:hypothetical protein
VQQTALCFQPLQLFVVRRDGHDNKLALTFVRKKYRFTGFFAKIRDFAVSVAEFRR